MNEGGKEEFIKENKVGKERWGEGRMDGRKKRSGNRVK